MVPVEQPSLPVAGGAHLIEELLLKQSQPVSNNLNQSQSISTSLIAKHLLNQVEEYVAILNSLDSRRGKKPLDVNNVIYSFKNTRAAVKRAQVEKNDKM